MNLLGKTPWSREERWGGAVKEVTHSVRCNMRRGGRGVLRVPSLARCYKQRQHKLWHFDTRVIRISDTLWHSLLLILEDLKLYFDLPLALEVESKQSAASVRSGVCSSFAFVSALDIAIFLNIPFPFSSSAFPFGAWDFGTCDCFWLHPSASYQVTQSRHDREG